MGKTPKLVRVDLSKGKESDHPDIKLGKNYLIRYGGDFYAGKFSRQWFGFTFFVGSHSLQFDTPGTNHSRWQEVWEIREK